MTGRECESELSVCASSTQNLPLYMLGQEPRADSLTPNAVLLTDDLLSKLSYVGTQVKSLTGEPLPDRLPPLPF